MAAERSKLDEGEGEVDQREKDLLLLAEIEKQVGLILLGDDEGLLGDKWILCDGVGWAGMIWPYRTMWDHDGLCEVMCVYGVGWIEKKVASPS